MQFSKTIVAGNLTRDPELKALPSGGSVCEFGLATNETYTKDGKTNEQVEYHNIVVYGKQAENCAKYLIKGQSVLVEGKNRTRSWDKDGVKHYRTEIVAQSVQFGQKSSSEPKSDAPVMPEYPEDEINPEDIPF